MCFENLQLSLSLTLEKRGTARITASAVHKARLRVWPAREQNRRNELHMLEFFLLEALGMY